MSDWTVSVSETSLQAWIASIQNAQGDSVFTRRCRSEEEAEVFASTVRQHLRWLSEERFREYYRV